MEYRRDGIGEWYRNTPRGLEQGFTLARRPGTGHHAGPLVIAVEVRGGLRPVLSAAGDAVLLQSGGRTLLRYAGLEVRDARSHIVPSRMDVQGQSIRLLVQDSTAEYPLVVDPYVSWYQQAELTASDGTATNDFGGSVSVSGNMAVVGAPYRTVKSNLLQGAVYVFVESGGTWTQQAELAATDGAASDQFGNSVSLSGITALVGASEKTTPTIERQGAAYIFVENSGSWTQQAELTAADGALNDLFGTSVSLSGNTALAGAPYKAVNSKANQGAAYVFVENGGTWTQQAELTAADGALNDLFGTSVSLSGNTALVGAYYRSSEKGAAYVFFESGGTWIQQAELTAANGAAGDGFGSSASLSGNTVLVSAPYKTVNSKANRGAAYVFVENDRTWTQLAELTATDGAANDEFGSAVSLDGSTALVGTPKSPNNSGKQGAAYVFLESPPAVVNPSFEQGSSSPVSFTGLLGGGASAATGWSIWNNYSGTTMTELCTATSCPSGSVPPAPVDGAKTLHVTTTGASSGVYQIFPSANVFSASLWLKVVSGTVVVEMLGPGNRVVKTTTGTGVLWLPVNGMYDEIVIYSLASGKTEFYADDVVLSNSGPASPPAVTQISPTSGPVDTMVTFTGTSFGAAQQSSSVTFNGTPATPADWSDTSIQVPVPAGATTGNVVVTVSGAASNEINFTVTTAAVTAVPANPDFESGSASVVSFTGTGNGGASAATGWSVWNNNAGTTTTELCTASACPSGSTPPAPVEGSNTLHVTTSSELSGVYQFFPQTALVGARLWLDVVSGKVTVTLRGPDGSIAAGATGSGWVTLPSNGAEYREITIYSEGSGKTEFYVDAVTLTPPPVTNSSFELGSSSSVSFTGTGYGGQSATTGWSIVNGAGGTTMTELCKAACPSSAPPPKAVSGITTLHVSTTGPISGVYQTFRDTALLSAALWLKVLSGSVTVELFGPSGPLSKTVAAGFSGGVLLPANGGVFNEILIASSGSGPAAFFADAVTLSPVVGTLTNPSFEQGSSTLVSFTGLLGGGPSAATGWSIWNNESGTTRTELCAATSCPSGSVPPASVAGTKMLHVMTTSASSGVYQKFPQTALYSGSEWMHVISGTVQIELLNSSSQVWTSSSSAGVSFLPIGVAGKYALYARAMS